MGPKTPTPSHSDFRALDSRASDPEGKTQIHHSPIYLEKFLRSMQSPGRPLIYSRMIAAPISDNAWSDDGSRPTLLIVILRQICL